MDAYSYILGTTLSDVSLFRAHDHVTHRCKDGSISRYPCINYVIALQCKDRPFADRVATALRELLGRAVTVKAVERTGFGSSTVKGLRPGYVFRGFQVRLKAKALWLRLADDRERVRSGDLPDGLDASDVLRGIVDGDGYVAKDGHMVVRTTTPTAVTAVCTAAGVRARVYDYDHQTAPQVNIPRLDAMHIDTIKRYAGQMEMSI